MRTIFFCLILRICALGQASDFVNGGDVIVCPQSTEALAFYEARTHSQLKIDLDGRATAGEIIEFVLNRLGKVSPLRVDRYRRQAQTFFDEALVLEDSDFEDGNDWDHTDSPIGCKVEKVVWQRIPRLPGEKRYLIHGTRWKSLDPKTQAGVILSEISYREVLEYGHTNSIASRVFVGFVSSKDFEGTTDFQLMEILKKLRFDFTDLQGLWVFIQNNQSVSNEFFPGGQLKTALVSTENELTYRGYRFKPGFDSGVSSLNLSRIEFYTDGQLKRLRCRVCGPIRVNSITVTAGGLIEFYSSGKLKFVSELREPVTILQGGQKIQFRSSRVELSFFESGIIESIGQINEYLELWHLSLDQWLRCDLQGQYQNPEGKVLFYSSGHFRSCPIAEGRINILGRLRSDLDRGVVRVSEEGQVLQASISTPVKLTGFQAKVFTWSQRTDGKLRYVKLAESGVFMRSRGGKWEREDFPAGTWLAFDESGRVTCWERDDLRGTDFHSCDEFLLPDRP